MTVLEWVQMAPTEVREELQCVPVMNFLRQHRNARFQMVGAYDGAMSEECKESCRVGYKAVNELVEALEAK